MMQTFYEHLGILIPEIYLPKPTVDRNKWSVVACDQYTSQPAYREAVETFIGNEPSTYHITFPEVYLHQEHSHQRIATIQAQMHKYLEQGLLESKGNWLIFVDRQTSHTTSRKWLMLALDLEKYDYSRGAQTLIRASEGTVIERLPPRIKIRQEASLESPHILVLIDDPHKQVIEPLAERIEHYEKLYDFDLMMNGGHVKGYHITDDASIQGVIKGLENLANGDYFKQYYGVGDEVGVLLFAMGDGNHSFATAKAIREEKKKSLTPQEQINHPARFALVELENIHDEGITFEPIHRVLFNVERAQLLTAMAIYCKNIGSELSFQAFDTKAEVKANLQKSTEEIHYLRGVTADEYFILWIKYPKLTLEVGNLQTFLDSYLKDHPETEIDYVHGEEATEALGKQANNLGLLLPVMDKADFFKTVIKDWMLPRKTFSMGEAEEKRFYLECRKIQ